MITFDYDCTHFSHILFTNNLSENTCFDNLHTILFHHFIYKAEMAEKQRMKELTLNINDRQEEEDYQG